MDGFDAKATDLIVYCMKGEKNPQNRNYVQPIVCDRRKPIYRQAWRFRYEPITDEVAQYTPCNVRKIS